MQLKTLILMNKYRELFLYSRAHFERNNWVAPSLFPNGFYSRNNPMCIMWQNFLDELDNNHNSGYRQFTYTLVKDILEAGWGKDENLS